LGVTDQCIDLSAYRKLSAPYYPATNSNPNTDPIPNPKPPNLSLIEYKLRCLQPQLFVAAENVCVCLSVC